MLIGVFQLLQSDMPDFLNINDFKSIGIIFGSIFVAGILFTWLSTFFALRKYLKIKESEITKIALKEIKKATESLDVALSRANESDGEGIDGAIARLSEKYNKIKEIFK